MTNFHCFRECWSDRDFAPHKSNGWSIASSDRSSTAAIPAARWRLPAQGNADEPLARLGFGRLGRKMCAFMIF
jgi:hypothetical protein